MDKDKQKKKKQIYTQISPQNLTPNPITPETDQHLH